MLKLYGNYLSPYTRRVAVSMHLLEIPFELEHMYASSNPEIVRPHNPLGRIPTLIDDDGAALVDSWAILDTLDQRVDEQRRLLPGAFKPRRAILNITALAVGLMEKAQHAFYEEKFHQGEAVSALYLQRCEAGVCGALTQLDTITGSGWLHDSDRITQADISTAVAFRFVATVRPELDLTAYTRLAAHSERCEVLPAFQAAAAESI